MHLAISPLLKRAKLAALSQKAQLRGLVSREAVYTPRKRHNSPKYHLSSVSRRLVKRDKHASGDSSVQLSSAGHAVQRA